MSSCAFTMLCIVLLPLQVCAQSESADESFEPSWAVGATFAVTDNRHTRGVAIMPDCDCRDFGGGEDIGIQYGVAARYQATWHVAIDMRLVVDSRPAEFESMLSSQLVLLPNTSEVVRYFVSANSTVAHELVTFDALASARVPIMASLNVGVSAGPSFGLIRTTRYTRWIDEQDAAYFTGPPRDSRTFYNVDTELEDASSLRVAARVGAGLEVDAEVATLRLGAYYDHGLTPVVAGSEWYVNTGLLELAVLVNL